MLLLLLACTRDPDTDRSGDTEVVPTDTDTVPTGEDVDQDGSSPPVDCDDFDPARHPGATEVWNGEDDDCDGRSDGDGTYSGSHTLDATAIYEGQPHHFRLDCPTALLRDGSHFEFTVTCTTDSGDDWAALLLGATLTIDERDNVVNGDTWAGAVVFASSNGWDADGTGSLAWDGFDATRLVTRLSTVSLDAQGQGNVGYQAP